jgi:shikimate dehydrogenase
MKQYGLIGYPLTHSFSPKYFADKFAKEGITDSAYNLYPLQNIDALPHLLAAHPQLLGLNVTIPYKEAVLPYLHQLDSIAEAIGAVNCIKVENDKLIGYNTDAYGFEVSLNHLLRHKPDMAFVLGTGGAAKAVWYVLNKLGIPFVRVSTRQASDSIGYAEVAQHLQASNLIVNTTPLGMYPNVNECVDLPYHLLTAHDYLFDLIYNPAETLFMHKGKEQGAAIMSGLLMLRMQAEESWEIWQR